MKLKMRRVECDVQKIIDSHGLGKGGEIQRYIDSEVLRRCEPYVPRDTGGLIRSGVRNTEIGSGQVVYNTPYARRWYYEPAKFQGAPKRGNYWFDRMCNEGGREAILRGCVAIAKKRT